MENKHTPGPWNMDGPQIVGGGYGIGHVTAHNTSEGRANALLFTAAPDLLEALEGMLEIYGVREQHMSREPFASSVEVDCCNQARAAIAKARGIKE